MKLLVFVGSPNKTGHTMSLVNEFIKNVKADIEIINVFDYLDVKSCTDCGYCKYKAGCSIDDKFTSILEKIIEADSYVIASPMWFGTISGQMLSFFSRLQTISTGILFRKDIKSKWEKAGLFIMTTGSKWHSMAKSVETTVEFVFAHMDAQIVDFIYANKTDVLPARNNLQALARCKLAAERLNKWFDDKQEGRFYKYLYSSANYLDITENIVEEK